MTNKTNRVLYIGITDDICRRVYEHKQGKRGSFTKKYKVQKLLYIEKVNSKSEALKREQQLKKWKRDWKCELIQKDNPHFEDIYGIFCNNSS